MKTAVVQIGNSDDKLTQSSWARFVSQVGGVVNDMAQRVHFFGAPPNFAEWQNACWVFEINEPDIPEFRLQLALIALTFDQESIALLLGETGFVFAKNYKESK